MLIEPAQSDDALLADINSISPSDPRLHVWWLGQSGFLCRWQESVLLFDPYLSDSLTRKYAETEKPHVRMSRRVIDPGVLRCVHVITSTHMHTDHADAETLQQIATSNFDAWRGRPDILVPEANLSALRERAQLKEMDLLTFIPVVEGRTYQHSTHPISAVPVAAAHPELTRDEQGRPIYVGFIAALGPFTIYHSGDGVIYDGMIEHLRPYSIDLAILPINGKVGNMNGTDAARLAKAIGAKLVVPCHYHLFEFNTAEPEELFVPECERIGQPYRVLRLGERLTLEAKS